jgi:hypothetical protein
MSDAAELHVARAMELLDEVGAVDVEHPSGTLMQHLRGTYDILVSWACPDHVCLAGLYHSVYGTEAFRTQTIALNARERGKEAIGARAEELAFLYCAVRRSSLYDNLDRGAPYAVDDRGGERLPLDGVEQLAELLTLDVANRLEQLDRTSTSATRRAQDREIYERAVPLLPSPAVSALRAALPRMSTAELLARRAFRRLRRDVRRIRGTRSAGR